LNQIIIIKIIKIKVKNFLKEKRKNKNPTGENIFLKKKK
jgi:hypothetical protein